MKANNTFKLEVTGTDRVCNAGEIYGRQCRKQGKIPVFSCEGGCIKGEIARQTANLIAKEEGFSRACHGELFAVPHADLARWVREADKVVVIDGCALFCHSRIAENIICRDKLAVYDALAIHRKYADLMDVDDVPEDERKKTAREVAGKILANLNEDISCCPDQPSSCECAAPSQTESACCG